MLRFWCMIGVLAGCGTAPQASSEFTPREDLTVVAAFAADTVWLQSDGDSRTMVWTTSSEGRQLQRWRSRDLHGAMPRARLAWINDDAKVDLFWTIDHEELVGGMVLLADGDSARVAYTSAPEEACRSPELIDVTGDGRLDIIQYLPYGFGSVECRMDAAAAPCIEVLPTEWAVVWGQTEDGFAPDPNRAQEFYARLADEYRQAANDLERAIRTSTGVAALSPRCDRNLLRRLRELTSMAEAIKPQN
jgi:hypothetical protein